MTAPASNAPDTGGETAFGRIPAEVDATIEAVRKEDWVSAGLDGATTALDALACDPLSSLADAGFGFLTGLVSFLEEPLKTLSSDPGAVTSPSQSLQGAGETVSSLSGAYAEAGSKEISGWSGAGATRYQNTAATLADGLRTIAKASSGVSSALEGASKVVGQARQIITQLIGEATTQIGTIMSQAFAAAPATGGASVAAAIPQAVGVAAGYGQQIAGKMGALLSSSQNLASLLLVLVRALEAADKVIGQIAGTAGRSSNSSAPASAATMDTAGSGIGTPPSLPDAGGSDPEP